MVERVDVLHPITVGGGVVEAVAGELGVIGFLLHRHQARVFEFPGCFGSIFVVGDVVEFAAAFQHQDR